MKKLILIIFILSGCSESIVLNKNNDSNQPNTSQNPNESEKSFASENGGYVSNGQYQMFFKIDSSAAMVESPNGYKLILIEE